jgi:hypothetical protein
MGGMAHGTVSCRDRTVEILEACFIRMAGQTEVLEGLHQQLGFL